MESMKISLWFVDQAEQAAQHYVEVFGGEVTSLQRYPEGSRGKAGDVVTAEFTAGGQRFVAINGGEHDKPNDAVSIVVPCADQAEVDRYWNALTADGGSEGQCGWLKDKYGFAWQIVPVELSAVLGDPDPERAARATQAMYGMTRIDLADLRAAADGN